MTICTGSSRVPWYLRKSFSRGPIRINLSKRGIGVSAGVKGFRIGTGPRGPYAAGGRGGLYFRQSLRTSQRRGSRSQGSSSVGIIFWLAVSVFALQTIFHVPFITAAVILGIILAVVFGFLLLVRAENHRVLQGASTAAQARDIAPASAVADASGEDGELARRRDRILEILRPSPVSVTSIDLADEWTNIQLVGTPIKPDTVDRLADLCGCAEEAPPRLGIRVFDSRGRCVQFVGR